MRSLLLMLPILTLAFVEARAAPCLEDAGSGISQRLVLQCLEVSNNTRRCNAENTCAGLRAEIEHGCGQIDHSKPKFCNSPRATQANSCREAVGAANAQ